MSTICSKCSFLREIVCPQSFHARQAISNWAKWEEERGFSFFIPEFRQTCSELLYLVDVLLSDIDTTRSNCLPLHYPLHLHSIMYSSQIYYDIPDIAPQDFVFYQAGRGRHLCGDLLSANRLRPKKRSPLASRDLSDLPRSRSVLLVFPLRRAGQPWILFILSAILLSCTVVCLTHTPSACVYFFSFLINPF